MASGLIEVEQIAKLHHGRLSEKPELELRPFTSCLPQEVILMHLFVKVVSLFGTIVLRLRWKRH